MEIIYKHRYITDTLEAVNEVLGITEPELEKILFSHSFFSSQNEKLLCDFMTLALACNRLAAYEDSEIELALEESTAKIFLTAPCFLFQTRQLVLWQKLCLFASEIEMLPDTKIIVSFDFSKTDDKLYSYFAE